MRSASLPFALCAVSILGHQTALAALLPVTNPSFEAPVTAPATFSGAMASGPNGWTVYNSGATNSERFFGVWNPSTTSSFVGGAPDGSNVGVVFLQNTTAIAEAGLRQVLASTLQLSTHYTLMVEVGNFSDVDPGPFNFTGFPGYRVELFAGGTLLASDNNTLTPGEGIFATSTVSFATAGSHANAGQQLAIRLVNLNGPGTEVNFDNVRLDASAVVCGDNITNGTEACDLGASAGCTGVGTPFACCTGVGTGACNGAADSCCSGTCTFTGNTCRAALGNCDLAEVCSGASQDCPTDDFASAATECRHSAGSCDIAEHCTGVDAACPADEVEPASTECRAIGGVCDAAEHCDGVGTACPTDVFADSTIVCRASAGICDVAEECSGSSASCPVDAQAPSGTSCGDPTNDACTAPDTCDGLGACAPNHAGAGSACADDGNPCTTNLCDGAGLCAAAAGNAGAECRPAVGDCDVAEECTGSSTSCPGDGFVDAGTVCRASTGGCDLPETCSGGTADCPSDGGTLDCGSCMECDEIAGCVVRPRDDCTLPERSDVLVRNSLNDAVDKLSWTWRGVAAKSSFGNPLGSTEYRFCLFDDEGGVTAVELHGDVQASGLCDGKACWRVTGPGFSYNDRRTNPDGLRTMKLSSTSSNKATIKINGKGSELGLDPALDIRAPVTAQLEVTDPDLGLDQCWQGTYLAPLRSDSSQFRARE